MHEASEWGRCWKGAEWFLLLCVFRNINNTPVSAAYLWVEQIPESFGFLNCFSGNLHYNLGNSTERTYCPHWFGNVESQLIIVRIPGGLESGSDYIVRWELCKGWHNFGETSSKLETYQRFSLKYDLAKFSHAVLNSSLRSKIPCAQHRLLGVFRIFIRIITQLFLAFIKSFHFHYGNHRH